MNGLFTTTWNRLFDWRKKEILWFFQQQKKWTKKIFHLILKWKNRKKTCEITCLRSACICMHYERRSLSYSLISFAHSYELYSFFSLFWLFFFLTYFPVCWISRELKAMSVYSISCFSFVAFKKCKIDIYSNEKWRNHCTPHDCILYICRRQ